MTEDLHHFFTGRHGIVRTNICTSPDCKRAHVGPNRPVLPRLDVGKALTKAMRKASGAKQIRVGDTVVVRGTRIGLRVVKLFVISGVPVALCRRGGSKPTIHNVDRLRKAKT
jgi:hypothetical protein